MTEMRIYTYVVSRVQTSDGDCDVYGVFTTFEGAKEICERYEDPDFYFCIQKFVTNTRCYREFWCKNNNKEWECIGNRHLDTRPLYKLEEEIKASKEEGEKLRAELELDEE